MAAPDGDRQLPQALDVAFPEGAEEPRRQLIPETRQPRP